ncbi:hypothetical protein GE115_03790 [Agromyces sp. CFH 90414]|uniref:DUF2867 domain-containing protein n=1 Tax=Agromyces agglutinans TaxID=2662258 RepID=A0A6I2F362_9MICO|nr:hypothetical protein [Agromyces agglutinans]MRG58992.1 hypothetical protein [Agromyces agglutinans]
MSTDRVITRSVPDRVRRAIGVAEVPPRLAALVTLPDHDYLDAFTLEFRDADRWTAETWARAMFEDDRAVLRRAATRGLLGVMLSRPAPPGRIGNYTVVAPDPRTLRGDVESKLSEDQVIVIVGADEVSLVTAVRYRVPIARLTWGALSNLHRSFAPRVLRYAAARIR